MFVFLLLVVVMLESLSPSPFLCCCCFTFCVLHAHQHTATAQKANTHNLNIKMSYWCKHTKEKLRFNRWPLVHFIQLALISHCRCSIQISFLSVGFSLVLFSLCWSIFRNLGPDRATCFHDVYYDETKTQLKRFSIRRTALQFSCSTIVVNAVVICVVAFFSSFRSR